METTQIIDMHSSDAQEYRRLLAWRMYTLGYRQIDIATTLQVTRGAVSQWIKRARHKGAETLRKRKANGPNPRLTPEQLQQLPTLLKKGAEAYSFRGDVWTRERVAKVIQQEFGVSYSHAHISKVLRQIGWSKQKPVKRATQRNEEAIDRWKQETLPALKKGRSTREEPSCISMRAASICCPQ